MSTEPSAEAKKQDKMKFYCIKRGENKYEGTFIAESAEIAFEIAKKNGFKVDKVEEMCDTTLEVTKADKIKNKVTGGTE